jgi:Domain of unknown function (DUF1992)
MPWQSSDGRTFGGSYESWIDRQINEANERGEFDDLPGTGKPLPHLGNPDDPEWWIKQKIAREQLDMTAALPPQLALRKEAERLPELAAKAPSERAVHELVDDFNARVRECWRRPLEGPPVVVGLADADEMVTHWRARQAERPTPAPAPATRLEPAQKARPTGWVAHALSWLRWRRR